MVGAVDGIGLFSGGKAEECPSDGLDVVACHLKGLEKLMVVSVQDVDQLPRDGDGFVPVVELAAVLRVAVADLLNESLLIG